MQIVIEISEKMYKNLVKRNTDIVNYYEYAIYLGTVLPEHTEPKTGHWIESPNAYACSECRIIRAKGTTGKYNYCPNCGAKMKETE